jgi:NAD(P)-dependent dehydrogenase (short-subunit alcohol dehydrogenase family)
MVSAGPIPPHRAAMTGFGERSATPPEQQLSHTAGVRATTSPRYFSIEINAAYLASPQGQGMLRSMPMGRFGQEGELDGALLLLSSNAGSFMTDVTMVVDGGHMLAMVRLEAMRSGQARAISL